MRCLLILFIAITMQFSAFAADTTSFAEKEQELAYLYTRFWNYDVSSQEHMFYLIPRFKRELEAMLNDPASLDYQFKLLAKKIKIRESADGRLRIFSFDENSSFNWRRICSIAQYVDDHGKVRTRWLSIGDEYLTGAYTDVWVHGIHDLGNKKRRQYLAIGTGTHGDQEHHMTLQVFYVEGKELKHCNTCFENVASGPLVIQAIIIDHFNLIYNEEEQEISYSTFERDEASGYYIKTGKRTKLRYNGVVFRIDKY